MDVSAKLEEEDMEAIMSLQTMLRRRGIRASKKDILHIAVTTITKDPATVEGALSKEKKDNTRELFEKLLNYPIRFKGNPIEEHDTVM